MSTITLLNIIDLRVCLTVVGRGSWVEIVGRGVGKVVGRKTYYPPTAPQS